MTSPWKTLSWITGLVIFFSGLHPATAEAAINPSIHKALQNPAFACQGLTLEIDDEDQENLELLISSRSHIDLDSLKMKRPIDRNIRKYVVAIQSVMWVPGSADFADDVQALEEIESLRITKCKRRL